MCVCLNSLGPDRGPLLAVASALKSWRVLMVCASFRAFLCALSALWVVRTAVGPAALLCVGVSRSLTCLPHANSALGGVGQPRRPKWVLWLESVHARVRRPKWGVVSGFSASALNHCHLCRVGSGGGGEGRVP